MKLPHNLWLGKYADTQQTGTEAGFAGTSSFHVLDIVQRCDNHYWSGSRCRRIMSVWPYPKPRFSPPATWAPGVTITQIIIMHKSRCFAHAYHSYSITWNLVNEKIQKYSFIGTPKPNPFLENHKTQLYLHHACSNLPCVCIASLKIRGIFIKMEYYVKKNICVRYHTSHTTCISRSSFANNIPPHNINKS